MTMVTRYLKKWLNLGNPRKALKTPRRVPLQVEELEARITPDTAAFGPSGIDALGLRLGPGLAELTGSSIAIGQVELYRPGKLGDPDTTVYHAHVTPVGVFLRGGNPTQNGGGGQFEIVGDGGHATSVAGAIIGNGPAANDKGVAPGANLWSSAWFGVIRPAPRDLFSQFLLSAQKVALVGGNNPQAEAINLSMSLSQAAEAPDGNALPSLGIDWMGGARQANAPGYDTLFVVASGNSIDRNRPNLLSAAYNGLVVASTRQQNGTIVDQNCSDFRMAAGNRRLIDLVAPGVDIRLPVIGFGADAATGYADKSGSSYAAPQATGAVALLAQYAKYAVAHYNGWTFDALAPEVMKAVLMNSADKIAGRLGMQKTIYDHNGQTWDSSDAADIPGTAAQNAARQSLPLSADMGTGQLDVRRALNQYSTGEYHPVDNGTLPTQGWDFNSLNAQLGEKVYHLPTLALADDSYVSATLTWNRTVNLQEAANSTNGRYDAGETFQAAPLADLDLLLVDRSNNNQVVWQSNSTIQNVEHIFFKVPNAGHQYDLVVKQMSNQGATYALAWWAKAARQGAGMVQGTAWTDGNNDGLWESGEGGSAGVYVALYNANHIWMDTVKTDSSGHYQFQNLDPGSYYVQVTQPDGYQFAAEHVGTNGSVDSDVDADGLTDVFTVTSNEQFTMDVGLQPLATGSVSGSVWNDTNGNGIQNSGEAFRQGVSVNLYDSSNNLIDTTVTDSNGTYQFNSLPAAQYYVNFAAPVNYGFTTESAGSDGTLDSDANSSGNSATITLGTGEQITHLDAGLVVAASSVQGWVWNDTNADGIQGDGETSAPNVEVKLYDSSSNLVATTTSDEGGQYEFDLLSAGSYYVVFSKPSALSIFSPENQGSDTSADSDADSNGQTATFTLGSAEIKTHVDAGLRDAIAVTSVEINGGSPVYTDSNGLSFNLAGQNSVVEQILLTFNQPVTLDSGAVTITNLALSVTVNSGPAPNALSVTAIFAAVDGSDNTQYVVTFSGDGTTAIPGGTGTVIKSGVYQLNIIGADVHANGFAMPSDSHTIYWALYGSVVTADNATSGGTSAVVVDNYDYSAFVAAYGSESDIPSGTPAYNVALDGDLNGFIDNFDYSEFGGNFGADWMFSIDPPA